MSRLRAFLPHGRILILLMGVVGPFFLMGMRGERQDLQVAMALCAGLAVGCSFVRGPVVPRVLGILAAVAAIVFQAMDILGADSTWSRDTAPVLWALQALLTGCLCYMVWWAQDQMQRA